MNIVEQNSDGKLILDLLQGLGRFLIAFYNFTTTNAILLLSSRNSVSVVVRAFLGGLVLALAGMHIFAGHSFHPIQLYLEGAKEWNTSFIKRG